MGAELFLIPLAFPLAFISPIILDLFGRSHCHLVCTNDIFIIFLGHDDTNDFLSLYLDSH